MHWLLNCNWQLGTDKRSLFTSAVSFSASTFDANSCSTFVSAMLLPSIVTRNRLATTRLSSPSLLRLFHFSNPGLPPTIDRLLVAVRRFLLVAGSQEHRPRRDQHLAERRVDDLHGDLRLAHFVLRLGFRERNRRRHALAARLVALPTGHLGERGLQIAEADWLDRLAVGSLAAMAPAAPSIALAKPSRPWPRPPRQPPCLRPPPLCPLPPPIRPLSELRLLPSLRPPRLSRPPSAPRTCRSQSSTPRPAVRTAAKCRMPPP